MKRLITICALFAVYSNPLFAGTWTALDYPKARMTVPRSISGNSVVGQYVDESHSERGFFYDGNNWMNIDYPSAVVTYPMRINGNKIVGYCVIPYYYYGFIYDGNSWSKLRFPGTSVTYAYDFDGNNIVGAYEAYGSHVDGFIYDGIKWTTIYYPKTQYDSLYLTGISGNNIVGLYVIKGKWYGFLYKNGTWTILNYPGAIVTKPWKIEGNIIVGEYADDNSGNYHGFIYDGTTWTSLNYPGAVYTVIEDINGSNLVGSYLTYNTSLWRGFIYTIPKPVANAGPNQITYAWIDGIAEVNLDGSGSYDEEGRPLTYLWKWSIDGNTYEANDINFTIELPAGQYTFELVVNDGIVDSEPNQVVVTVIEPLKSSLCIFPKMINGCSNEKWIMAMLRLPGSCPNLS